jgi:hypothetical protein
VQLALFDAHFQQRRDVFRRDAFWPTSMPASACREQKRQAAFATRRWGSGPRRGGARVGPEHHCGSGDCARWQIPGPRAQEPEVYASAIRRALAKGKQRPPWPDRLWITFAFRSNFRGHSGRPLAGGWPSRGFHPGRTAPLAQEGAHPDRAWLGLAAPWRTVAAPALDDAWDFAPRRANAVRVMLPAARPGFAL